MIGPTWNRPDMPIRRYWLSFIATMLLSAATAGCARTSGRDLATASIQPRAAASKPALPPLAFADFCMRNGAQCRSNSRSGEIVNATPQAMTAIEQVNRQVNTLIRPTDKETEWRVNPMTGNCNDYVVSKQHALLASGFPSSALLISVVKTPGGVGHLVLLVKTDQGDLVLDNLTGEIRTAAETPYLWVKRQTSVDPWKWEAA